MAASKATYPAPGAWVHGDHRPRGADKTSVRHGQGRALRLVQWNIERGYELHRIIDVLREVKGDVLALQELDIGCERTGFVDVCDRIARELGMAYVFCTEFVEHHSPLRSARNQGGGAHGNAVLSRFDLELEGVRVIRNHQPFPWQARGGEFGEPRDGFRNTLAVPVATPQGRLLVYSCHMELFCGIADRVRIFSEILEHARERAPDTPHQCIMGDFNTMAHSIARLSPNYCNDHLRFTTLGYDEAEWWSRHLLSFYDHHGEINHRLARALRKPWRLLGGGGGGGGGGAAAAAAAGGSGAHALPVDDKVLRAARNPGFYDPFDVLHDITLTNYRGLFVGKLDWTLLRGMECVGRGIDNHDYRASDHKLLYVDVVLDPPHEVEARIRLPHRRTRGSRSRCRIATAVLALLALVLLAAELLGLLGEALALEDDSAAVPNMSARSRPRHPLLAKSEAYFAPRAARRFVGIDNRGATCYLNSLLQAMFCTPELRERLFRLSDDELGVQFLETPEEEKRRLEAEAERLKGAPKLPSREDVQPLLEAGAALGKAILALRRHPEAGAREQAWEAALFGEFDEAEVAQAEAQWREREAAAQAGLPKPAGKCWKIPVALRRLFAFMQLGDQIAADTEFLTWAFGWRGREVNIQQDIHELNRVLMDRLGESLQTTRDRTLVSDLYSGVEVRRIFCCGCKQTREREMPFGDLALPVVGMASLEDSLREYVAPELLDRGNQVRCELGCGGAKRDAVGCMALRRLPPILTLALRRFAFNRHSGEREKVLSRFAFPLVLDMAPFLEANQSLDEAALIERAREAAARAASAAERARAEAESAKGGRRKGDKDKEKEKGKDRDKGEEKDKGKDKGEEKTPREGDGEEAPVLERGADADAASAHLYDLFAVLVHVGTAFGGHYHAFIRDVLAPEPAWYDFDDSRVSPASERSVAAQYGGKRECAYMLIYRHRSLACDAAGRRAFEARLAETVPPSLRRTVDEFNAQVARDRAEYQRLLHEIRVFVVEEARYEASGDVLVDRVLAANAKPSDEERARHSRELLVDERLTGAELHERVARELGHDVASFQLHLLHVADGPLKIQPLRRLSGRGDLSIKTLGVAEDACVLLWGGRAVNGVAYAAVERPLALEAAAGAEQQGGGVGLYTLHGCIFAPGRAEPLLCAVTLPSSATCGELANLLQQRAAADPAAAVLDWAAASLSGFQNHRIFSLEAAAAETAARRAEAPRPWREMSIKDVGLRNGSHVGVEFGGGGGGGGGGGDSVSFFRDLMDRIAVQVQVDEAPGDADARVGLPAAEAPKRVVRVETRKSHTVRQLLAALVAAAPDLAARRLRLRVVTGSARLGRLLRDMGGTLERAEIVDNDAVVRAEEGALPADHELDLVFAVAVPREGGLPPMQVRRPMVVDARLTMRQCKELVLQRLGVARAASEFVAHKWDPAWERPGKLFQNEHVQLAKMRLQHGEGVLIEQGALPAKGLVRLDVFVKPRTEAEAEALSAAAAVAAVAAATAPAAAPGAPAPAAAPPPAQSMAEAARRAFDEVRAEVAALRPKDATLAALFGRVPQRPAMLAAARALEFSNELSVRDLKETLISQPLLAHVPSAARLRLRHLNRDGSSGKLLTADERPLRTEGVTADKMLAAQVLDFEEAGLSQHALALNLFVAFARYPGESVESVRGVKEAEDARARKDLAEQQEMLAEWRRNEQGAAASADDYTANAGVAVEFRSSFSPALLAPAAPVEMVFDAAPNAALAHLRAAVADCSGVPLASLSVLKWFPADRRWKLLRAELEAEGDKAAPAAAAAAAAADKGKKKGKGGGGGGGESVLRGRAYQLRDGDFLAAADLRDFGCADEAAFAAQLEAVPWAAPPGFYSPGSRFVQQGGGAQAGGAGASGTPRRQRPAEVGVVIEI